MQRLSEIYLLVVKVFDLVYNMNVNKKELWLIMIMGKNRKGKHMKKNQRKAAKLSGKKVIDNKIIK